MSLLNRKRLRWLRRKPTLVIPASVVRAHPTEIGHCEDGPHDDEFIWGTHLLVDRRYTIHLPTEPVLAAAICTPRPREGEVRSHVSFDAEAAQARLAEVLTNERGQKYLTKDIT